MTISRSMLRRYFSTNWLDHDLRSVEDTGDSFFRTFWEARTELELSPCFSVTTDRIKYHFFYDNIGKEGIRFGFPIWDTNWCPLWSRSVTKINRRFIKIPENSWKLFLRQESLPSPTWPLPFDIWMSLVLWESEWRNSACSVNIERNDSYEIFFSQKTTLRFL